MQAKKLQQTKVDFCFYCFQPIVAPVHESIVKCGNKECRKLNIFLCHVINPDQRSHEITCLKCSNILVFLNCSSCGGFQGWSKSQQNFKNGMKHQCPCQAIYTLIYCQNCESLISIKGRKTYQLSVIRCKKCTHSFRYKICETCDEIIYKESWDKNPQFLCLNENCQKVEQEPNPYFMGHTEHFIKRIQQFEKEELRQSRRKTQLVNQKQLCKICFNSEANMINTKCFHLAVCESCSSKLTKQCPICRSEGGQFKKVFKS